MHPLWNHSFKSGCISSSEKELLIFSYPTLIAEDGHTGEHYAGVCLTEIRLPSTCSRHMTVFGEGWSGSAATTALTFKMFISVGSSRSFTAFIRRQKAIAKAEREIAKLEAKIAALDAEANGSDYQKLMELSAEREGLENELLELYEQWEELNG